MDAGRQRKEATTKRARPPALLGNKRDALNYFDMPKNWPHIATRAEDLKTELAAGCEHAFVRWLKEKEMERSDTQLTMPLH